MVGGDPPDHGMILTAVPPTGAAGKAGLQKFDVLTEIDGIRLDETIDLSKALANKQPGDTISVEYWSHGKSNTAKIKLDEIRGD